MSVGDPIDEANRIKARLWECKTASEVEAVADQERENVRALAKVEGGRVLAIHIANLKAYQLRFVEDA